MNRTAVIAMALTLFGGSAGAQTAQVRVRYIVSDVPTTVAFYTANLGFKVDAQAGVTFAALSRGGVQLLISPTRGPGGASQPMPNGDRPTPGGWNRIVIYTADLQGETDRLRKAGVRFRSDIIKGLGGSEIVLEDPSGNPVELFQPG